MNHKLKIIVFTTLLLCLASSATWSARLSIGDLKATLDAETAARQAVEADFCMLLNTLNTQYSLGFTPPSYCQVGQIEFDVVMTSFGSNKVSVIKAVRSATGLGLKEVIALVESAPVVVKEAASRNEAEDLKKLLEEAGASIEFRLTTEN